MRHLLSRRRFLAAGSLGLPLGRVQSTAPGSGAGSDLRELFPRHPPELVREMVTVAHFNAKRVRELVDARPSLARAAWDWGFGDWEDALGAASHTGNREIAEYLISRGARPSLFSAAMLGQLDVVRALIAAMPGAQRIAGPHSISLLKHAKAGGAAADGVRQYLDALGDADGPHTEPITSEEAAALAGRYVFGSGGADWIDVTADRGQLTFTRAGSIGRPLYHVGDRAFFPAGAAAARIRFTGTTDGLALTVQDPDLVLTATRRSTSSGL